VYFRFAAGLLLVVLVSMAGVQLEKQTLELRRAVSVQYYQTDVLLEMLVRLRLETQRLTAPTQPTASAGRPKTKQPSKPDSMNPSRLPPGTAKSTDDSRLPVLRFQHPFNPEGID
jgi:hypothetical protein